LIACATAAALQAHLDTASSLSVVLGLAAVASGLFASLMISASFVVVLLAAVFLGPASSCIAAVIAELTVSLRLRTPRSKVLGNVVAVTVPAIAAANVARALAPASRSSATFYVVVALCGALYLACNLALAVAYARLSGLGGWSFGAAREYLPSIAINVVLAVAGAGLYVELGLGGILFGLAAIGAFSYMAMLLDRARTRAQQYVSLSWGVLAGLLRALDTRDQRAARHAAAVARFSADIAAAVGMDKQQVELAHTAGLLHDIGHFALSDRVAERDRVLTDEDWEAIYQHPELGADLLRDLGMYGPVAEIVRAHHERIDGRGYPSGLTAGEIPELAKIIAVAEVYDTLTASDTYRTRLSSFEALRELRRVAGSQLDARYVEVLAELLSGEGVEYRHADAADFDAELDMERRIGEVASG
jgi:putative nucleotidyltransferase with HDIG domain